MTQYITSKTTTSSSKAIPPPSKPTPTTTPILLQNSAYGQDDDSVSTLGNHTSRKWNPGHTPSPLRSPPPIPYSITPSDKQAITSDERSLGSVSTLTTRINNIEGQFQELSGTMEQIKDMLNLIANPRTAQDGDPRLMDRAGRGNSAGESL